jgi:hypothetical protein
MEPLTMTSQDITTIVLSLTTILIVGLVSLTITHFNGSSLKLKLELRDFLKLDTEISKNPTLSPQPQKPPNLEPSDRPHPSPQTQPSDKGLHKV